MACSNVVLPFTLECAVTISCRIVQSWQGPSVSKLNHMHNCCLTKVLWSRKKQFLIKETQISNRHNVHRGGRSAALLRPLTCTTNEKMVPVNSQQTTYLHPYLALVRYSPTNGTDSPITIRWFTNGTCFLCNSTQSWEGKTRQSAVFQAGRCQLLPGSPWLGLKVSKIWSFWWNNVTLSLSPFFH